MKPSDTITLNAPSEFPLQILHEVAIMTILITRGESLRARPLPPARCARCLPTAPPVFPQRQNKNKQKPLFFSFKKQTRFCFLVPWLMRLSHTIACLDACDGLNGHLHRRASPQLLLMRLSHT